MACKIVVEQPAFTGRAKYQKEELPFSHYGLKRSARLAQQMSRPSAPARVTLVCDRGVPTIIASCSKSSCSYAPYTPNAVHGDDASTPLGGVRKARALKRRKRTSKVRRRKR